MFKEKNGVTYDRMGELNTLVGKSATVEGNIVVEHSLRIDGKLVGNVKSTDSIIVGKDGHVEGEMDIKNAVIGGTVRGKVTASGKVTLESSAVFIGQLKASKLVIAEGACFDGSSHMKHSNSKHSSRPIDEKPKEKSPEDKLPESISTSANQV